MDPEPEPPDPIDSPFVVRLVFVLIVLIAISLGIAYAALIYHDPTAGARWECPYCGT